MRLNELSATHLSANGSPVGFMFKSTVSGKVFTAVYKTSDGKFVCEQSGTTKTVLLEGDNDRYVAFGGSVRIGQIESRIRELESQRDMIEEEIATLDNELDQIHSGVA